MRSDAAQLAFVLGVGFTTLNATLFALFGQLGPLARPYAVAALVVVFSPAAVAVFAFGRTGSGGEPADA